MVIIPFLAKIFKNGGKLIIHSRKDSVAIEVTLYIEIALCGIAIATVLNLSSALFWIFNSVGLMLFLKYFFRMSRETFIYVALYLSFAFLTLISNHVFINRNLEAIGTNVNTISFIIMFAFIMYLNKTNALNEYKLVLILKTISYFGAIAVIFAWYYGFSDIIRVYRGMNPYVASLAGFFHGKNPYGAFVSLTVCPDLYFFYKGKNNKTGHIVLLGIKLLAIVLSFSRAALLQVGIMLLTFIWFNRKHRGYEQLFILLAATVFLMLLIENDRIQNFILRSVFRLNAGDAGRAVIRYNSLETISALPLIRTLLVGVGYFGIVALQLDLDNTYLYLLFSGGLLKILFFTALCWFSFTKIKRIYRIDKLLGTLCLAVAISYYPYAFYEEVAFLELGILHFLFTLYLFIIPAGYMRSD